MPTKISVSSCRRTTSFGGFESPLLPHHRNLHLRRILLRMMDDVVGDDAGCFVIVSAAGVQIAIEAREVAAGNFQTNPMARFKEVARVHWLQADFVDLAAFHPRKRLVVAITIPETLD